MHEWRGRDEDKNVDTLTSILNIINREAKQRKLESADEFKDGHPIGIKCDNCGGTRFNTFGQIREERQGAPGFTTAVYLHCEKCHEMIFLVTQSTLFIPNGLGGYRPHWNIDPSITAASIKHFEQYEEAMGKQAIECIDWITEKSPIDLIDWI